MKPDPTPAVILALPRSGTTFLCHALSNHPEIYCPRDEPIHPNGWNARFFKSALTPSEVLRFVHRQAFYSVNICKVMYYQTTGEVMSYLSECEAKVIHLVREDLERLTVSQMITSMTDNGIIENRPILSHRPSSPIVVHLDPDAFVQTFFRVKGMIEKWRGMLEWYPTLEVKYADMVGGEGNEAKRVSSDVANEICDFLDVERHPLSVAGLKTVNTPYPLEQLVENWGEIKERINEVSSR